MKNMWNMLEKRTRAWNALGRQGLADVIWADYVSKHVSRFWRKSSDQSI